jgi:transcriptional regulator with XRE-family HTH domain
VTFLEMFGATVRARRQSLGVSQEALADMAGLHRTYIGGIERGERNLTLLNLLKLARALRTRPSSLLRSLDKHPELRPTSED